MCFTVVKETQLTHNKQKPLEQNKLVINNNHKVEL